MTGYLTTKQLAKRWNWNFRSLANQRCDGRGPKSEKVGDGRTILYPIAEVEAYERTHPEVLQKKRRK